jgi:hypothetical protein
VGGQDRVLAIETERGILVIPYDCAIEEALAIAADGAREYRNGICRPTQQRLDDIAEGAFWRTVLIG